MGTDVTVPVTLPREFMTHLGTPAQAAEAVKEFTVLGLYQESRISAGKAAELLGLTRRGFLALLARKGIPPTSALTRRSGTPKSPAWAPASGGLDLPGNNPCPSSSPTPAH